MEIWQIRKVNVSLVVNTLRPCSEALITRKQIVVNFHIGPGLLSAGHSLRRGSFLDALKSIENSILKLGAGSDEVIGIPYRVFKGAGCGARRDFPVEVRGQCGAGDTIINKEVGKADGLFRPHDVVRVGGIGRDPRSRERDRPSSCGNGGSDDTATGIGLHWNGLACLR